MKLENDLHPQPWSAAQPPSPLRFAALGRPPEDMARPSKEFCSTCTADLWEDGDLWALQGTLDCSRAGAGGLWWGRGGDESQEERETWTQVGSRFWWSLFDLIGRRGQGR